jgi:hypothetical protein
MMVTNDGCCCLCSDQTLETTKQQSTPLGSKTTSFIDDLEEYVYNVYLSNLFKQLLIVESVDGSFNNKTESSFEDAYQQVSRYE